MIESKGDLKEYLAEDKKALGVKQKHYILFISGTIFPVWKWERLLRKSEYYKNTKGMYHPLHLINRFRLSRCSQKLHIQIPLNVCGKGLNVAHYGPIIVNGKAKIGDYCRIHVGVNIGVAAGTSDAPTIGNNVYIGPGAKLFGKIIIGDNIAIGANAVVNKSFTEPNIAIAGVPAKKINDKGSKGLLYTPDE